MTNSIKLLDGNYVERQEVLDNMYSDDYYYNYLGKNALSSSSIKLLLDSAKTYLYVTKYGQKETQPLRDGHLFHTMVLEPDKLNDIVLKKYRRENLSRKDFNKLVSMRPEETRKLLTSHGIQVPKNASN